MEVYYSEAHAMHPCFVIILAQTLREGILGFCLLYKIQQKLDMSSYYSTTSQLVCLQI